MSNWKYLDNDKKIVFRVLSNGIESSSVTAIAQSIADGNIPDPADPPSKAQLNAIALANLVTIDAKKIRALTDAVLNNDKLELIALEAQAVAERVKIVK